MLTIEREIYNNKPWYKNLKPKRCTPKNMYNRKTVYSWLGFIFYNSDKLDEEQRCYIYCPRCHTELISTSSYSNKDESGLEHFKCKVCGTDSYWDFSSAMVPILIDSIDDPTNYYSPIWKGPKYDIKHSVIRYGGRRE